MPRWDDNKPPLAWMILALVVAVVTAVVVVMYFGVGAGILTFVGIVLLAGELEAMGLLSKNRD